LTVLPEGNARLRLWKPRSSQGMPCGAAQATEAIERNTKERRIARFSNMLYW